MRVREHKGYGHGLSPGETRDINCLSCKREQSAGAEPVITGHDDLPPMRMPVTIRDHADECPRCNLGRFNWLECTCGMNCRRVMNCAGIR